MAIQLSSDSDALICVLYAEYLSRRAHGVPIDDAVYFPSHVSIHDSFLPDWILKDVYTVCIWLSDRGLISGMDAEEDFFDIKLTEDGIIYMESRFSRRREAVLAHLKDLIGFGLSVGQLVFS